MSITLVALGTKNHSLTRFAIDKTLAAMPNINKVKVFSDRNLGIGEFHELSSTFNLYDYSVFAMKELNQFIDTDHVVMCHYDGFAVNGEYWKDSFLQYDYIGSATHYKHPPLNNILVNARLLGKVKQQWYSLGGGFCLRSKKMLNALADPKIETTFFNYAFNSYWSCEDISIGIVYKKFLEEKYDIKFGSIEDSIEFCAEILTGYNYCLGFHGWQQIPFFLDENETISYIKELTKINNGVVDRKKLESFFGNCYNKNYYNAIEHVKKTFKL